MKDERLELGLKMSESMTIEQVLPVVGCAIDFKYDDLSAGKKFELVNGWIDKVCSMNELSDVERVAYGEFLYGEQRRLYPAWRQEEKLLEIKRCLPMIKPLVRKAGKSRKCGDADTALQLYLEAFNLLPLLPSIGLKAAAIARSKYKLRIAQHIANTVASKSYEKSRYKLKASAVAIEAAIRLFMPWLEYGLAPKQIMWMGGEGGTRNLFEVVKNPYVGPRKRLTSKQQQFVDSLGTSIHLVFSITLSSICGEDDLDFPVLTSPDYVNTLNAGFDLVRDTIIPNPRYHAGRRIEIGAEYKEALQHYLSSRDHAYDERFYRFTNNEPIWYWPSEFLRIYASNPEPWMVEHNAMIKNIEDGYSEELVEKIKLIKANEINRWKAMFSDV